MKTVRQVSGLVRVAILVGVAAILLLGWQPAEANAEIGSGPSVPGTSSEIQSARLMVKYKADVQTAGTSVAGGEVEVLSTTSAWPLDWKVLEVDAAHKEAILEQLRKDPRVAAATLDYPLELAYQPNDPGFLDGAQWGLNKVNADIAWEFSTGEAITVAIVDSGIDGAHPDLAGQIVPGYNFVDDNADTSDPCGHGTHVAGIVAAAADNAEGVAGIAHNAKLMPIKVINDDCTGSYSLLMLGILRAVENDARIIVITSGGAFDHDGVHEAIQFARQNNVAVMVAAGNRGNDQPFYPGSYEESFTVGGTDRNDGPYARSNYGEQIDISAPATQIFSTYYTEDAGSTYAYMTGTSMSTPHVAGVAALLLALDPDLPLADLEATLRQSATDLGEPGWDPIYGAGRVDALRAMAAFFPATGTSGNVRNGHIRIPDMYALAESSFTLEAVSEGMQLSWQIDGGNADHTAVIYRSTQPVFESAVDLAEVDLVNAAFGPGNQYMDTDVEADVDYFYWLVEVDRDVEIAVSEGTGATYVVADEESQTPPATTRSVFLPLVQRG